MLHDVQIKPSAVCRPFCSIGASGLAHMVRADLQTWTCIDSLSCKPESLCPELSKQALHILSLCTSIPDVAEECASAPPFAQNCTSWGSPALLG